MDIGKIFGQMLCVGFEGTDLGQNQRLIGYIEEGLIGSVILYAKNIDGNPGKLIEQLRGIESEYPLWIMIDQEGGHVQRIKDVPFPSHREVRQSKTPEEAFDVYREMAHQLADYDIDINLAPVVDLNIAPGSPIIGFYGRSFSRNPDVVFEYAKAFIDAHRAEGVRTCIKHYPGHGSSPVDTHKAWADVTRTWQPEEAEIFKRLVEAGYADMLMTSHVFHAGIDAEKPACLSPKHVEEIIREQWHYDGLIIADDVMMKAIMDHYHLRDLLEYSLNAGNDLLLFSDIDIFEGDYVRNLHRIVKKLHANGKINMTKLTASCQRVIRAKGEYRE